MGKIKEGVNEFAMVAFVLLGVLFGMVIMNIIFSSLGNSSLDTIDDLSVTVTNLPGAFIDETPGYKIPEANNSNFLGNFVVTSMTNTSAGSSIDLANITVDATLGTIINSTPALYTGVNITYTFTEKAASRTSAEQIQNNSLNAVVTYTNQSDTQFTTVSIAITLVILIAVFLLFWKIFVSNNKSKKDGGNFA